MKKGTKLTPEQRAAWRFQHEPDDVRFWSRVDRSGGPDACWPWMASCSSDGYGKVSFRGGVLTAHRVAMILTLGEVPADMDIDHWFCRNRKCCNPAHLRVATQRQNAVENNDSPLAINARKTHCKYGHPLSGDNIRVKTVPGPKGSPCTTRLCLACYGPGGIRRGKNRKEAS